MSTRYAGLAGLRILVVEDEFLPAALIEQTLRELRCDVLGPVSNLDAALAAIQRGGFDAAFLDVNVRGRAATPAAAELAARKVPFVLVTGYAGAASDVPVMRSAPRIVKPFTWNSWPRRCRKPSRPTGDTPVRISPATQRATLRALPSRPVYQVVGS